MSMFQNNKPKKVTKSKDEKSEKKKKAKSSTKLAESSSKANKEEERAKEEEERRLKEEAKKLKEQKEREEKKKKEDEKKAREARKAAAAQAAANDKEFGESLESELRGLETAAVIGSAGDAYNLFPESVYTAYGRLQEYARDLNTSIAAQELVFVGGVGAGKSTLVDAVLGARVSSAKPSVRPTHLTLVCNSSCAKPRITIKRDATIAEYDTDMQVSVGELAEELADRNRSFSETPIFVLYESADVMNMTLIDLPGMSDKNAKAEALAVKYMSDTSRQIIACEAATDFSKVTMLEVVKKCDPELTRSTFVFTKFNQHLRTFTESRELNRYLSQAYPDVPTFFISLPSSRVPVDSSAEMQKRVHQAYCRDMAVLEQLQHDKRHEKSFGAAALRSRLMKGVWRASQDAVPRVLKQLRARAAATETELRQQQAQSQALNSSKLRAIGSHYVVSFLQSIQRLLEGTADGNPSATGQLLKDERRECGQEEWLDGQNRPIRFDDEEWKIPYADAKLYGGQQFERALAEFRAVVSHTELGAVSFDEIASSAGLNRLNNVPNFGWAASDLAATKSREAFVPLIDQLTNRVVFIVKRLAELSDSLIEAKRAAAVARSAGKYGTSLQTGSDEDAYAPEHYPYFTHHVKDLFNKFVDQAAQQCKEKCMDEFYSTRTIYWHLSEYGDRKFPTDRDATDEAKKAVTELANELFVELRDRIVRNVLLKFYNFFLVPLQAQLANDIQGKITTLSDKSLEQLFHLSEMQARLAAQEKRSTQQLQRLSSQDERFRAAASAFAHPVSGASKKAKKAAPAEADSSDED